MENEQWIVWHVTKDKRFFFECSRPTREEADAIAKHLREGRPHYFGVLPPETDYLVLPREV